MPVPTRPRPPARRKKVPTFIEPPHSGFNPAANIARSGPGRTDDVGRPGRGPPCHRPGRRRTRPPRPATAGLSSRLRRRRRYAGKGLRGTRPARTRGARGGPSCRVPGPAALPRPGRGSSGPPRAARACSDFAAHQGPGRPDGATTSPPVRGRPDDVGRSPWSARRRASRASDQGGATAGPAVTRGGAPSRGAGRGRDRPDEVTGGGRGAARPLRESIGGRTLSGPPSFDVRLSFGETLHFGVEGIHRGVESCLDGAAVGIQPG